MAGMIRDKLNPLYQRLFKSAPFDHKEIKEPRSTCESCAMCDHGQLAPVEMGYFNPSMKCCTWHPALLNFLVGGILSDPDPALEEGRRRIREAIAARKGVTAIAMLPTARYQLLYAAGRGNGFGRATDLKCPYYSTDGGGMCTVWRYRESVCSTWFCKYENGKPGFDFWGSMKKYLSHAEASLGVLAARAIDPSLPHPRNDPNRLTLEELQDEPPTAELYASYWGSWVGREEEFYRACYAWVRDLTPEEFAAKVDNEPTARGLIGELNHRLDVIENRTVLPERLVRAADLKTRPAGKNVVVTSYNPFDAFAVDRELFDVLAKLDGTQPLAKNLERLDKEEGVELQPDLLQYLFTHGVVEAPAATSPAVAPASPTATNVTSPRDRNKDKARRRNRR